MATNIGEIDELRAKLGLVYWRDNNLNNIQNVGYYEIDKKKNIMTYFEYPTHTYSLSDIRNMDTDTLKNACHSLGIIKASSRLKADVYINNNAVSLKSKRGALPALINHTHRAGIEKVCKRIKLDITPLDIAISNYWNLRLNNQLTEDVKMINNNPFTPIITTTLIPLLQYYLFVGTAQGDSDLPASMVVEFEDALDYTTWNNYTLKQATASLINKTTISIRSKGMPDTYNHNNPTSLRDISIEKWTEFIQNKYKGSLHIRG